MPKIKFSTLVSGVSGKSNGSVFAKNRYGNYFRTLGSRLKTPAPQLSNRKSIFANVAQTWKKLNYAQVQSWVDNAHLYPTVDTFGDERIPAPYELFCKLNNVRVELGLELLMECPLPRTFPTILNMNATTPDLKQYRPLKGVNTGGRRNSGVITTFSSSAFMTDVPIVDDIMYFLGIDFSNENQAGTYDKNDLVLMSINGADDAKLTVSLLATSDTLHRVQVDYTDGVKEYSWKTTEKCFTRTKRQVLGVGIGSLNNEEIFISINGIECPGAGSGDKTAEPKSGTDVINFIVNASEMNATCIYSQFSVVLETPTEESMRNGSMSYVLGTEYYAFDAVVFSAGKRIPNTIGEGLQSLIFSGDLPAEEMHVPYAPIVEPSVLFTWEFEGDEGFVLALNESKPVSINAMSGRPGKRKRRKIEAELERIYRQEWECEQCPECCEPDYTPSNDYSIDFSFSIIDSQTGQVSNVKPKPPKKPRFKAGAEMSNSVN